MAWGGTVTPPCSNPCTLKRGIGVSISTPSSADSRSGGTGDFTVRGGVKTHPTPSKYQKAISMNANATCCLTASLRGARICSASPSMVRPSASCSLDLAFFSFFCFWQQHADAESGLFEGGRDCRTWRVAGSARAEEEMREEERSRADAAPRSMDLEEEGGWWNPLLGQHGWRSPQALSWQLGVAFNASADSLPKKNKLH